ncbi:tudor domain-containing protein 3-like [Gigantopelta aegis]|uniref:tudor domain-containing protein 3-like n=1 Tax=Gigantopelta aegis TaxID=1735272 RepID=UPI001B88893F|nr:tudor domain-containing protein 3-like [Gigantopelta aegis]
MAGDELARRGWHLSEEGLQQCSEHGKRPTDQILKNAFDTDLKEIGEKWLPEELSRGRLDYLQGPAVLQVQKLRNIAAPKENEHSQTAPRLLKLTLTDGHMTCIGIETENLKNIGLNTAPGSKILLDGTVDVENSFLLLSNKNFKFLGGRVDHIAENWEFKMKLAKQNRSNVQSEGGPPLFVPFGKKIQQVVPEVKKEKKENFKSLAVSKEKSEVTEFDHQRQATIAEALQAKEGVKVKTFGSKLPVNDKDVARIVEMGFSPDQATEALKQCNGDVAAATHTLLNFDDRDRGFDRNNRAGGRFERNDRMDRGQGNGYGNRGEHGDRYQRGDRSDRFERGDRPDRFERGDRPDRFERGDRPDRFERGDRPDRFERGDRPDRFERGDRPDRFERGDRGDRFERNDRGDRFDKGDRPDRRDQRTGGRGRRGRDDETEDGASSRPSGPATLFDFLTTKIPVKEENKTNGTSDISNSNPNKGSHTENRNTQQSYSSNSSYSSKSSSYAEDASSHNPPTRKPNLPPRLANKFSQETNPRKEDFSNKQYSNQQSRTGSSQSHYSNNSSELQDRVQNSSSNRPESDSVRKTTERNQTRPAAPNTAQHRQQNSSRRDFRQDDRPQDTRQDSYGDKDRQAKVRDRPSNFRDRQMDGQSENPKWANSSGRQNQNDGQESWPRNVGQMWKEGDTCLAKYWEDNQFYTSRIEAMAPPQVGTCVVTFLEYGNAEEVLLSDIRPISKPNWQPNGPQENYGNFYHAPRNPHQQNFFVPPPQMPISNPPPYPGEDVLNSGAIGTMEFRRGGSGTYDRSRANPKSRPTQKLYQPPVYQPRQNSS